ncbi:MAG: shikimate kinase [Clostridia bacterium]|nr:shikimate kinase [Clostridia bacterium]
MKKTNIVLIGMPSSGKSTVGARLAKELGLEFIDTDSVIRQRENRELKEIVNIDGLQKFLEIQEKTILELNLTRHVIATGGGVIYGAASMEHLKMNGIVIYLETDFEVIEQRIAAGRRFARNQGQSFFDLYNERVPLYKKYADAIVQCTGKSVEAISCEIIGKIPEWKSKS